MQRYSDFLGVNTVEHSILKLILIFFKESDFIFSSKCLRPSLCKGRALLSLPIIACNELNEADINCYYGLEKETPYSNLLVLPVLCLTARPAVVMYSG